jgi:hypothetical protein
MDPITTTILSEGGKAVLTGTIKACLEKLFRRKKKNITAEEKKQIEKTAEKMIQAATWDDVLRFDPKYQAISGARRRGAAKKAAPKRRLAFKKAAPKRVAVKKFAGSRPATKKR